MEVVLTEKDANALRNFIYELIKEEVENVREDAGLDKQILKQGELADYFGVASSTIRTWETHGMPFVSFGSKLKFYDKVECRKWLMEKSR
ncbi:terminase small subunit [Enterococcus italicus]|uniref:terminase small subunit n=1 Tax=Enterococcus italicus TaxID=246144 RepID=UPI0020736774|nr:terminase small subunit [Enterococcus italicus]